MVGTQLGDDDIFCQARSQNFPSRGPSLRYVRVDQKVNSKKYVEIKTSLIISINDFVKNF